MERVHIGTMGWSYDQWIGNFYPRGAKKEELLSEYAKYFDSVEVDSTFYRVPKPEIIKKWVNQTPKEFIFAVKFPRAITHEKMLENSSDKLEFFLRNISLLGSKLGPLLIQFPHNFKLDKFNILKDFLSYIPKQHRYVIEVRNTDWLSERFYSLLRDHKVALALLDSPWMPDIEEITAKFIYIRWEGNRKKIKGTLGRVEKGRIYDIIKWAEKIKTYLGESIEVFGYFSKFYSGYPPTDAKQLLKLVTGEKMFRRSSLDHFF